MSKPILWIVIPCYNEEQVLPITAPMFLQKITSLTEKGMISDKSRVLFVNDGSRDKTWELIQGFAAQDEQYIGISQSRNRGHQNAVLAGLMEALHSDSCDITISIDCDGQDDINAMDAMVDAYVNDGCEVVYGVRSKRDTDTFFKRFTAESFYKLLNAKGKVLYKDFGELLFTHFGISGPTVLSASCHLKGDGCRLVLDLKPALESEKLEARILRDLEQYQNRSMENALVDLLPRSMIPVVLRRLDISPEMQANSLTKQKRRALVELLKAFPIDITGKRPVSEAIITSGGVKVSEIDPKTMESKRVTGLYFAGEVIDCDAYTGGFNLQIAWATAYAAGMAVG